MNIKKNFETQADPASARRLRRLSTIAAPLAILLVVVWWPGCRQYDAVTSEKNLYLMKLLYTACNTKDPARLAKVKKSVAEEARQGNMSEPEQEAFAKIVGMAEGGDWQAAQSAALRFAQDQIGRGQAGTVEKSCCDKKHK